MDKELEDLIRLAPEEVFGFQPTDEDLETLRPSAKRRCAKMTSQQHDWFRRMTENVSTLREQYHGASKFDEKLLAETDRKVKEAVRRLKVKVVDVEEHTANNEWWDGEADRRVEWLNEALRIISIYTQEPDDAYVDFERLYELEMDRRHHAFHGDVPPQYQ